MIGNDWESDAPIVPHDERFVTLTKCMVSKPSVELVRSLSDSGDFNFPFSVITPSSDGAAFSYRTPGTPGPIRR